MLYKSKGGQHFLCKRTHSLVRINCNLKSEIFFGCNIRAHSIQGAHKWVTDTHTCIFMHNTYNYN